MTLSRDQYSYMTDYIKRQYHYSVDWCKKVNKMPDDQVFAIFCSMKERTNHQRSTNISTSATHDTPTRAGDGIQLTIWDLMKNGEVS